MRPRRRTLVLLSALGLTIMGAAVGFGIETGDRGWSDPIAFLVFGALAGFGASVAVFPAFWGVAPILAAMNVHGRWLYAVSGLAPGLGCARPLTLDTPFRSGQLVVLSVLPDEIDALCGEVYWRMAVRAPARFPNSGAGPREHRP